MHGYQRPRLLIQFRRSHWLRICALVAALTLALVACGGDADTTTTAPPAGSGTATVFIDSFAFGPDTITVTPGTVVTWTNNQSVDHTVTGDANEFDSAELPQDAEFSQTFDTVGEFAYHCELHPSMTGTVIVEG